MSYNGPVVDSPRCAGTKCLNFYPPKPETVRSSEFWCLSTWLRGVNPPKIHAGFQKVGETNQIPSDFPLLRLGSNRTKTISILLSADVSSKVSTTYLHSPRFQRVPEQSGMRQFPLLAPWERFPSQSLCSP